MSICHTTLSDIKIYIVYGCVIVSASSSNTPWGQNAI